MYLLDTNIISDVYKRLPAPTGWLESVRPLDVYLSVVTLGEVARGITQSRAASPRKSAALQEWLDGLRHDTADRILPVTEEIALIWGRISVRKSVGDADGLIAATAIVHSLILVTRNVADFTASGVKLFNPWDT